MSDDIARLHAWIDAHRDEMVEALQGCLRIPSLKEAPAGGAAPFGEPIRQVLDYTLGLCARTGFRVKDVGGYAGHAEFGEGPEMVAAIGHLDVVPEGDGWKYPPFGAVIDGGYVYARGAADDKGPTYAALFAARALMETGLPLKRRVRVIFGCDEESGFGCLSHYWGPAAEERPVSAFTPDAMFPLVYAEKGITNLTIERQVGHAGVTRVVRASGGQRPNMVPDSAEARVEGEPSALYRALAALTGYWDGNVQVAADATGFTARAVGRSAHGSTPEEGDNAVARLARALLHAGLGADAPWLEWVVRSADPTGAPLGLRAEDDIAGPLTCNLGTLEARDGVVRLVYNVRYPVIWTIDTLLSRLRPALDQAGWALVHHTNSAPLHVPLDEEPAKTLMRVYREETGDVETKPHTMGGGTYARATSHAVAYGAALPGGSDGPAHEPNERIAIASLVTAARIYAHALYELAR